LLFNSIDFAIFLPVVFTIYWLLNRTNIKIQNVFLLASSYVFYAWWDWRFLTLILISTLADYTIGLFLSGESKGSKRKILLWSSVFINLGILGFFKYFNFFIDNFTSAFKFLGYEFNSPSLNIILPVGISFYTFQTLSYTIDVYRKKINPTSDLVAFATFVSFFPQLVAGPIERAKNLLPQFFLKRKFEYAQATEGLKQILWGFFKKVVIADNCAEYVNIVFANPENYSASVLLLGAVLFAFQIYGDFSGYSDIAIGTARLFGFKLMQNFAFPYFSRDIAEFWRRWHISLSTWFRDYLYIPLGGSRGSKKNQIRNVFIVFLVSGFWHGANWTFIFWGAIHAMLFLPLLLFGKNRKNLNTVANSSLLPSVKEVLAMFFTFIVTTFAWIFFRAENLPVAFKYISGIFDKSIAAIPTLKTSMSTGVLVVLILFLLLTEWVARNKQFALSNFGLNWPRSLRWLFYSFIVFLIGMYMQTTETPFIYFQF
jgi:alginate O-acetyltransferase complex protein AlgI